MKPYFVVLILALSTILTACDTKNTPTAAVGQLADDSTVTTKAKAALMADTEIKASDVNVETIAGVVTLTGTMANDVQAQKAIDIVRAVEGVKNVVSKITIKQVFYRPRGTSRVHVT